MMTTYTANASNPKGTTLDEQEIDRLAMELLSGVDKEDLLELWESLHSLSHFLRMQIH